MTIETTILLQDLAKRTRSNIQYAEGLEQLPINVLNKRRDSDSWSILECLEHLNLYGDFYVPEIEQRITASKSGAARYFKAGLLGNYFAKSMLPKEKLNKMKTFKDKNPLGSKLDPSTIDRFLNQQQQMLELLHKAAQVNLTKTKTSITISNWIKLRLGDTLRVVIYHNDRHMAQIERLVHTFSKNSSIKKERVA